MIQTGQGREITEISLAQNQLTSFGKGGRSGRAVRGARHIQESINRAAGGLG